VEADPAGGSFAGMFRLALLALDTSPFLRAVYSDHKRLLGSLLSLPPMRSIYQEQKQSAQAMLVALQQVGVIRADLDLDIFAYIAVALRYGLLNLASALPDEAELPMDRITLMVGDMIQTYLEPPGGVDSEAGKAVIRQMVAQMRQMMKEFAQRDLSP
jgi:TetR/AcrR family acrAB operon transcriptional repressor